MSHSNTLLKIVDSFDLSLFLPTRQVSTWYSNNNNNSNLVIDLLFLRLSSIELNNYIILSELQFSSDYVLLTMDIIINEEFIHDKRYTIMKNSQEEIEFITDFIKGFRNINMLNIYNKNFLKHIVQEYANLLELTWLKHSCLVNITR